MLEALTRAVVEEEMTLVKRNFIQSLFEGSAEVDPNSTKRIRGRYGGAVQGFSNH